MANLESKMVSSLFKVNDPEAFEIDLEKLQFEDLTTNYEHGTNRVMMHGSDFLSAQDSEEGTVDVVPLLQKHLSSDSNIMINAIYHEKHRYLAGESHLITKDQILSVNAEQELRKQIKQKMPDVSVVEEV